MPRSTAVKSLLAFASVALGLLGSPARAAELPDVASRLPESFDAAIVVPSLSALDTHTTQLITAMEISNLSSIEQLVTVMGLRRGMDFSRGAAAVLDLPEGEGEVLRVTAIIPVEDFTSFAKNVVKDIEKQRPGVHAFAWFGRQYFIKSLDGGYALIGETAESVRSFEPSGETGALASMLGATGVSALAGADAGLVLNVERSSGAIEAFVERYAGALASFAPDPDGARAMIAARVRELSRDGSGVTVALTPGQLGLRASAVAHSRAGSPSAIRCADASEARLLDALPGGEAYLAAGIDLSHPAMSHWFGGALPEAWTDGVRTVSLLAHVPASPFLASGGAQRATIRFGTDTPEKQIDALEADLLAKDDPRYTGQYGRKFKEYEGVGVDFWSFIPSDPRSVHPAIIGTRPDILGASAAHENAAYIFTTRDPRYAQRAMGLDGSKRFLEDNRVAAQVRAMLPGGASFELIALPEPILKDFQGLIAMFKPGFRVKPQVPPLAMNIVIGEGSASGNAFVPAATLGHAIELYNLFVAPSLR